MIPQYLVPKGYRYFVAGGHAVCPALSSDIDVWVQAKEHDGKGDLDQAFDDVNTHLKRWSAAGAFTLEAVAGQEVYRQSPGFDNNHTVIIGKLTSPSWDKPIHMLVTTRTPQEVVDDFDLSVCQVAITDDGQIIKGHNWTPPTAPIRMLANGSLRTRERMEKYSKRFMTMAAKPTWLDRARNRVMPEDTWLGGY